MPKKRKSPTKECPKCKTSCHVRWSNCPKCSFDFTRKFVKRTSTSRSSNGRKEVFTVPEI